MIDINPLAALIEAMKRLGSRTPNKPTRQKKARPTSRQNHGRGESKTRRLMAARSNKINRQRIKHWKH